MWRPGLGIRCRAFGLADVQCRVGDTSWVWDDVGTTKRVVREHDQAMSCIGNWNWEGTGSPAKERRRRYIDQHKRGLPLDGIDDWAPAATPQR
jgi:hypothetical protein